MARFAVFYLFASAAGPPGKKGDATKSGRPQGFAPSLIMLRTRPCASRPPLDFMALLTCESTMNDRPSLVMRLQGER